MRVPRYLRAYLVLFVVALTWKGLLHLVLLPGVPAAASHAFRPDLQSKLWLSLVSSAPVRRATLRSTCGAGPGTSRIAPSTPMASSGPPVARLAMNREPSPALFPVVET